MTHGDILPLVQLYLMQLMKLLIFDLKLVVWCLSDLAET